MPAHQRSDQLTMTNPEMQLFSISQAHLVDGWRMSDWAAAQTPIMNWEDQNVRKTATGEIELVLNAAPAGSSRAFSGAEVQSSEVATTGTWSWTAQAPKMLDGAVFGMFTYRADWQTQPWVEFDFEFVGKDTTKVQLDIHMEDASGRHISLNQAKGGPVIVDLGFDAAQGMNTYDVVVSETSATFRVNGKVVGVFGAADMPGGIWKIGPQKSYVDLWCASGKDNWTGEWAYDGTPLVAKVQGADVRGGDLSGLVPLMTGTDAANALAGNASNNYISGLAGNDTLTGSAGNDTLLGGDGNDKLRLDVGNDRLDGGNGLDWVEITGPVKVRVDLAVTTAQNTGFGMDTLRNMENFLGGSGGDVASGTSGENTLHGNVGNDSLSGRDGHDALSGGSGDDRLDGGWGNDQLFGGDGNDRLVPGGADDLMDGGAGLDWVIMDGGSGATVNLSLRTAQNTGYGTDTIRNVENVEGGSGNDRLKGDVGANKLVGGAGADTITGDAGRDMLFGGIDAVSDVFVFRSAADSAAGSSRDVIHDFVPGVDALDLGRIDANKAQSGDQTFVFSGASPSANGIWVVASGSDLIVRGDTNGDRIADFEVQLLSVSSVTADDFLL
jgi:serralysin